MKRRFLLAARLVLAALAASGCAGQAIPSASPIASATAPSAAASPSCTPIGATAATPCSQQQYDQLQQRRADYAEAERVYRAFAEADAALVASGRVADSSILSLLTSPMSESYVAARQRQHDRGLTGTGPFSLAYVRPAPERAQGGEEVVLESCVDATHVMAYEAGKSLGLGKASHDWTHLKRVGSEMKISSQETEVLAKC